MRMEDIILLEKKLVNLVTLFKKRKKNKKMRFTILTYCKTRYIISMKKIIKGSTFYVLSFCLVEREESVKYGKRISNDKK